MLLPEIESLAVVRDHDVEASKVTCDIVAPRERVSLDCEDDFSEDWVDESLCANDTVWLRRGDAVFVTVSLELLAVAVGDQEELGDREGLSENDTVRLDWLEDLESLRVKVNDNVSAVVRDSNEERVFLDGECVLAFDCVDDSLDTVVLV